MIVMTRWLGSTVGLTLLIQLNHPKRVKIMNNKTRQWSNPVQALFFIQALFSQLLKLSQIIYEINHIKLCI